MSWVDNSCSCTQTYTEPTDVVNHPRFLWVGYILFRHFQANKNAPTKLLNHTNVVGDDSQDPAGGTESRKDPVGTQHLQSRRIASSLSACKWTFMASEVEVKTVAL